MGTYLIPNAPSISEAADFIGEPPLTATWERFGPDVRFTDTARSNAQCAALYAGYVPSGATDETYRPPKPPEVQAAITTLQAIYQTNPASMTDAQTAAATRAIIVVLRYLNGELV